MVDSWYRELQRPSLTPPDWIFGPVWSLLYLMIAVSFVIFIKKTYLSPPWRIYFLMGIHLVLNFSWTPLFFKLHAPGWALIDILLMVLSLCLLIKVFRQTDKTASFLLCPYLAWISFATYLNAGFFLLNR